MTATEAALWEKIKLFQLNEPGINFSFEQRLVREKRRVIYQSIKDTSKLETNTVVFLICFVQNSFGITFFPAL